MVDEPNIGQILGRIKDQGKTPPEMPKGSPEDWAPKKDREPHADEAKIAQTIKDEMRDYLGWKELTAGECEALDLIATQMSRIIAGRNFWKELLESATLGQESAGA